MTTTEVASAYFATLFRASRHEKYTAASTSCEKRPIPASKLDSIVNSIEKYVQESPERERPTSKVGEMIMRRLKELDKVAYVRFASVYLEFEDVTEFMKELKTLVRKRDGAAARK